MKLSEFLNTRTYIYDYDWNEDGILIISSEDRDSYNILYATMLDLEGNDLNIDIYDIAEKNISTLFFYDSSFEISSPSEKQLDDFIINKMFNY